jgi:hypothetical protein
VHPPLLDEERRGFVDEVRRFACEELVDPALLQDGELFRLAGTADGTLIVLNAWDSRDACNLAMEKYMGAAKELGISMEGMSHEEYEIHGLEVAHAAGVAQ